MSDIIDDKHISLAQAMHTRFTSLFFSKQYRGVKEHGGYITDMSREDLLDNLEEELIDAWAYMQAIRYKDSQSDTSNGK